MISCKTALLIKNIKITIFNVLNRYSELWALLFSKLKKPVNLRILRSRISGIAGIASSEESTENFGIRYNLFGFYIRRVILIQQILVLKLSSYVSNYNSTHNET